MLLWNYQSLEWRGPWWPSVTRTTSQGLWYVSCQQRVRPHSQMPLWLTPFHLVLGSACLSKLSESWFCLLYLLKITEEKCSRVTLNHLGEFNRFILFDPVSPHDSVFGHLSRAHIGNKWDFSARGDFHMHAWGYCISAMSFLTLQKTHTF